MGHFFPNPLPKLLSLQSSRASLGSAKIFYHAEIIYFFDELSHFEKADSNLATVNPCLLLTRKRTSNNGSRTSALCQKRTRRPTRPTALARDDAWLSLSRQP